MENLKSIDELLELVEQSTSAFHTVKAGIERLNEAGFEPLDLTTEWGLNRGGKYYLNYHDSTLVAFTVGEQFDYNEGCRITAAHSDFPCIKIKPNPDIKKEKYAQINVEIYGGAILSTWLDRPLSVAGRVVLKSDDIFHPIVRLIDVKRPIFVIPNLAIHLNREVNKGIELNKQTDMLPIGAILGEVEKEWGQSQYFMNFLAQELHVNKDDILDFELNLYVAEQGDLLGMDESMISAPRLDNLTGVHAVITGLIEGERKTGINVGVLFDHEEIGSKTKQGAASIFLYTILEKIFCSLGRTRLRFQEELFDSLLLSIDVGHAFHPNQEKKYDITNKNILNQGLSIKESSIQSYVTDSEAIGIIQQICEAKEIPYQKFANRSDGSSGSTLGSIASTMLPIKTVDLGVPILAMHSARELMGAKDQIALVDLVKAYYSL